MSNESPLELTSSLFVCRTWHAIIVNDPTLWINIILNSKHSIDITSCLSPQNDKLAQALSFYEACIRRSKSAFLKITIDLESFSRWNDEDLDLTSLLSLFMERIRGHASRWKEFVWKANGNATGSHFKTQYFLNRLPQELPSLQQLTIIDLWDYLRYPDDRQFPTCPNLQTLSLIDSCDDLDRGEAAFFQQSVFSSVKDLALGSSWSWMDEHLRYMANFPNIHTLTLFSVGDDLSDECDITPTSITLPHLRLLRLRGWIPSELLSSVKPPCNLTVVVGHSKGTDSILSLSGTRIVAEMTILHLELSNSTNLLSPSCVFELLKSAPCLEAVYLPPPMEASIRDTFELFKSNHGYSFSICTGEAQVLR